KSNLLSSRGTTLPFIDKKMAGDWPLLKRLFADNFRQHYGWYGIAIAAMLLTAAMTAASAWIMREIVDGMVVHKDVGRSLLVSGAVAAIFTAKGLGSFLQ